MPLKARDTSDPRRWAVLIGIGIIAGLLSGLFGVGGGILIVPALVLLLGVEQRLATGTSLLAVVPISIFGVIAYLAHGTIDWRIAGLLSIGAITGGLYGSYLLARLPQRVLRWIFIAFMLAVSARLFFEVPARDTPPLEITAWNAIALILLGLIIGVLSGLLGVGGGVFIVPSLILAFAVGDLVAKGTSLLAVIPTGLTSSWANIRRRSVLVPEALTIGLAGSAFTFAGAALAFLIPARLGSILFAALLLAVTVQLIVRDLRHKK